MNRLLTPNRLPQIEAVNIHEVMERVRTLLLAEFPEGSRSGATTTRAFPR
jgi:two-component system nitrogen regulation sensor histidine kinase GlnL